MKNEEKQVLASEVLNFLRTKGVEKKNTRAILMASIHLNNAEDTKKE